MASWSVTTVDSSVQDQDAVNLGAEYDGVNIQLVTVPAHYGHTEGSGRKHYYDLGWISVGRSSGPHFRRVRVEMSNQLEVADLGKVDRVLCWLNQGVVISIQGANYTP